MKKIRIGKQQIVVALSTLVGFLVMVAAITAVVNYRDSREDDDAKKYGATKTACDVLTSKIVAPILGTGKKQTSNGEASPVVAEARATKCVYTAGKDGEKANYVASLTIQSPTSPETVQSVKEAYNKKLKDLKVQDTKMYGSHTFWDYKKGELNVLDKNIWYAVGYGPKDPEARSVPQTSELADILSQNIK